MRWLQKDETTFYMDEMERIQQWQYYISSYMRIEHTEGVVRSRLQKVLLERNLPTDLMLKDSPENDYATKPLHVNEGLVVRICLNSSKMVFEKGTSDSFIFVSSGNEGGSAEEEEREADAKAKEAFRSEIRAEKLKEKMVTNNAWMKGLSHEDVQKVNNEYQMWKEKETEIPSAAEQEEAADVTMEG